MERIAYRMPKAGNIRNLRAVKEDLPDPSDHEVTISVKSLGLNFADIFAMYGLYSATPEGSFIPGLEFSGVIHSVGKEVTEYQPGDRVMGSSRFGSYVSAINIDHRYIVKIPEEWTFQEAAAFIVQALTAYYALFTLGDLKKDQTVLIQSGGGGVGVMANRMAKTLDAYTIGTIGSPSKRELLLKEGYDQVIIRGKNYREELVKSLGDRQLDLILESIGGKILRIGFDLLAPMGRLIVYGSAQYATNADRPSYLHMLPLYLRRPRIDAQKLIESNKSVMGFNLIWLYEHVDMLKKLLGDIMAMDIGKPYVGHEFPFDKMYDAIRLFRSGATTGKVVINVDQ